MLRYDITVLMIVVNYSLFLIFIILSAPFTITPGTVRDSAAQSVLVNVPVLHDQPDVPVGIADQRDVGDRSAIDNEDVDKCDLFDHCERAGIRPAGTGQGQQFCIAGRSAFVTFRHHRTIVRSWRARLPGWQARSRRRLGRRLGGRRRKLAMAHMRKDRNLKPPPPNISFGF